MYSKTMYRIRAWLAVGAAVALMTACTSRGVGNDGNNNNNGNGTVDPWIPPIDNMGETGWRESTAPWSPGNTNYVKSFDIWSHAGGVYVLHSYANDCTGVCSQSDYLDFLLSFNDGTGWQTYWILDELLDEEVNDLPALTGFPDGRLVLSGGNGMVGELMILQDQVLDSQFIYTFDTFDTFVVNDQLAYAATDREEKLIRWNGQGWEPVPVIMPYTVYRLWANEDILVAGGDTGTIMTLEGQERTIHDTGTIETFTALWGFGADDLWAGTVEGGLFHYDGAEWTRVTWPAVEEPGGEFIQGMWGADGVLFFHTTFQLVRHDATGFTNLGAWPCTKIDQGNGNYTCEGGMRINAIWGNSPEELFLAVDTPVGDAGQNQNIHLLWYDGTLFHWF